MVEPAAPTEAHLPLVGAPLTPPFLPDISAKENH